MARVRIGDMLVAANLLTRERLAQALEHQSQDGRRLGDILVSNGWVTEVQLVQVLSQQLSVPWVSLHHVDFSRQLLNLVPRSLAEQYCLLPIYVRHMRGVGDTLYVAMDDPSNDEALRTIELSAGLPVRPMIAPPSDIRSAIRVYYGGAPAAPPRSVRPSATEAAKRPVAAPAPPVPRDLAPPTAAPAAPPPTPREAPAAAPAPSPPPPPTPSAPTAIAQPTPAIAQPVPAPPAPPSPLPPRATAPLPSPDPPAAGERPSVEPVPLSRRRPGPSMVTLTLLDGTTVQLPRSRPKGKPEAAPADESLTARDLVAALRAAARDADVSDILPEKRWEPLLAALLAVLLRKQLIADWEFVEEWKRTELT